jgi:competence protein ComEC
MLPILTAAWSFAGASPPPLVVTVLDVGQGDAILIRTPGGNPILIDGGPNPSALLDQIGRRLGLLERHLAVAILTHADDERLPGAFAALERYPAALAVGPPEGSTSGLYQRWIESAPRALSPDAPMTIALEPGLSLELTPTSPVPGVGRGRSTPRRSLALRLVHGDVAILIAPTLTAEGAQRVLAAGSSWRADGLYVPRHGEATALNARLIAAIDPTVAVLAVGARNRDDLPARATLDLLAAIPVHRTDLHGAVELRSDGARLSVVRERDAR